MKRKVLLSMLAFALSSTSLASNTFVQCGQYVDEDSFEVTGFELALSSEGSKRYHGPVGDSWNLKLGSENSEWLDFNRKITAKEFKDKNGTVVEVTIQKDRSISGPVGIKYRVLNFFDFNPVLEKYSIGGFAGERLIKTYPCISGHD